MEEVLIIKAARQIDTANRLLEIYWCCAGVYRRFLDWWKQGRRQQEAVKRNSKD